LAEDESGATDRAGNMPDTPEPCVLTDDAARYCGFQSSRGLLSARRWTACRRSGLRFRYVALRDGLPGTGHLAALTSHRTASATEGTQPPVRGPRAEPRGHRDDQAHHARREDPLHPGARPPDRDAQPTPLSLDVRARDTPYHPGVSGGVTGTSAPSRVSTARTY
jgi:hypothetical protein